MAAIFTSLTFQCQACGWKPKQKLTLSSWSMKTCDFTLHYPVVMLCSRKLINQCWVLKACSHHAISTAHEQAWMVVSDVVSVAAEMFPCSRNLHEIRQCANIWQIARIAGKSSNVHDIQVIHAMGYTSWMSVSNAFRFMIFMVTKCLLLCLNILQWSRSARCTFVVQVMALGDDWCGFADAEDLGNHQFLERRTSRHA